MKLYRILALIAALLLFCSTAHADIAAARIYDAAVALLTKTANVTLTGKATFSLDGKPFKFVDTTYVQDGLNSKWVLELASPRADGSLKNNGFTVIANDRFKYAIEVYNPRVYKLVECNPQPVILRPSAALTQLISLGHTLVEQIPEWSENELSHTSDGKLSIHVGNEQIPGPVSNLLTLGVLMAVQRTLGIGNDSVAFPSYPEEEASFESWAESLSPTRAITNCTEKYELTSLSAEIQMDESGRFTDVSGTARFVLHTFQDGEHELNISFSGKASDYGSSAVSAFDAVEYGVEPDEGTLIIPQVENGAESGSGLG